jgi:tetratricopeptide (TPR) repeat protein
MPDLLLPIAMALGIAAFVLAPVARPARPPGSAASDEPGPTPDLEVAELRHRIALEELRDIENDHRIGSLDEATYVAQRTAAEERAAHTLDALEALRLAASTGQASTGPTQARSGRVGAVVGAGLIVAAFLIGVVLPPPVGVVARTVVNEKLAAQREAEARREARIAALLDRLAADPTDRRAISDLADAYLDGSSPQDLRAAARLLLALIAIDPRDEDAHRRIIGAYLRAGDYPDARAALDAFEALDPDPADVAFFRGLIALNADDDPARAVADFDRFLRLAPDDDRAPMVRALRAEAASRIRATD